MRPKAHSAHQRSRIVGRRPRLSDPHEEWRASGEARDRSGLFGGCFGEGVAEGGSGGDAEFGEDLVKVGGDRSRGEEEAGGDLFVGVACRGEQGDLALLRGEGGKAGFGRGDGDAGGAQFRSARAAQGVAPSR
jgi:hypothetical protein